MSNREVFDENVIQEKPEVEITEEEYKTEVIQKQDVQTDIEQHQNEVDKLREKMLNRK